MRSCALAQQLHRATGQQQVLPALFPQVHHGGQVVAWPARSLGAHAIGVGARELLLQVQTQVGVQLAHVQLQAAVDCDGS